MSLTIFQFTLKEGTILSTLSCSNYDDLRQSFKEVVFLFIVGLNTFFQTDLSFVKLQVFTVMYCVCLGGVQIETAQVQSTRAGSR